MYRVVGLTQSNLKFCHVQGPEEFDTQNITFKSCEKCSAFIQEPLPTLCALAQTSETLHQYQQNPHLSAALKQSDKEQSYLLPPSSYPSPLHAKDSAKATAVVFKLFILSQDCAVIYNVHTELTL